MISRRSFIEGAIVLGSLGTWVAPGIWMKVLQPSPVRLAADYEAKVVGGDNFQGGLKGDLSAQVSLGKAPRETS